MYCQYTLLPSIFPTTLRSLMLQFRFKAIRYLKKENKADRYLEARALILREWFQIHPRINYQMLYFLSLRITMNIGLLSHIPHSNLRRKLEPAINGVSIRKYCRFQFWNSLNCTIHYKFLKGWNERKRKRAETACQQQSIIPDSDLIGTTVMFLFISNKKILAQITRDANEQSSPTARERQN